MTDPGTGGVLLSTRASRMRMSYALTYEFEDVLAALLDLRIVSTRVPIAGTTRRLWYASRSTRASVSTRTRADGPPLVVAVGQNQHSLADYLGAVPLLEAAGTRVAVLAEMWEDELPLRPSMQRFLAHFDHIFLGMQHACPALQEAVGRPVHYLPYSVDVLRFTEGEEPRRVIDAYAMGRRNAAHHDELLRWSDSAGTFYLYDTFIQNPVIRSVDEHRHNLIGLIRRSRVFLVNEAKVDKRGNQAQHYEIGFRYFEGAAGGAVLVGMRPPSSAFDELFGWRDSVLPAEADGTDIVELVASLRDEPERAAETSRRNVAGALRRHDVAHRARTILREIGWQEPSVIPERIEELTRRAARFE